MEYSKDGKPEIETTSVEVGFRSFNGNAHDVLEHLRREVLCNDLKDARVYGNLLVQGSNPKEVRSVNVVLGLYSQDVGSFVVDRLEFPTAADANDAFLMIAERNGVVCYNQLDDEEDPSVVIQNGFSDFAEDIVRLVGKDLTFKENED